MKANIPVNALYKHHVMPWLGCVVGEVSLKVKCPEKKHPLFWILLVYTVWQYQDAFALPILSPDLDTVCVGSANPKFHVIYLRGITPENRSEGARFWYASRVFVTGGFHNARWTPEIEDETLLDKIGKELEVKFAIPYSNAYCKGSRTNYCWGTEDPESVALTYEMILRSSANCFSMDKEWGLLGFSNGGYHAGRVVTQGHTPQPKWAIAVGSAGTTENISPNSRIVGTPFYLAIGTEDVTRESAGRFYLELKNLNFNVQYREFGGGHVLTEEILRFVLGLFL